MVIKDIQQLNEKTKIGCYLCILANIFGDKLQSLQTGSKNEIWSYRTKSV